MRSTKLSNRILLSSVAFSVSFFIGLVANRDFGKALLTGVITVPATYAGTLVVENKQRKQKNFLLNEIQAIDGERQDLEEHLYYLQSSLNQLNLQVTERHNQRDVLNREIANLGAYRHQLEDQGFILQTQVQVLETQKSELNQSLLAVTAEKQKTELSLSSLRSDLSKMQAQFTENQKEKSVLEQEITNLKKQKRPLQSEAENLQTQIQAFELQKAELNQSLLSLQLELRQLQFQIYEIKQPKEKSRQKTLFRETKTKLEEIPSEWAELKARLSDDDIQILKAILEQNNPSAIIKKIAEQNITMPQLLIDAINELAMDTIGDLIIEPGSVSVPPAIAQEYLTKVKNIIL